MQLFISFLISFNFISFAGNENLIAIHTENDQTVIIEVMNADDIPFDFTMQYEEKRQIIKIRSAEPIKSLRTVETASNKHKGYNVMGSDLIILPQRDFTPGSYIAELKFQNSSYVVLAKLHVLENPVADGE